jgi:hypothetical protein
VPALGALAGAPEGLPLAVGAAPGVAAPPVVAAEAAALNASSRTTIAIPMFPATAGRTNLMPLNR